jgi:hypothetical protein
MNQNTNLVMMLKDNAKNKIIKGLLSFPQKQNE